MPRILTLVALPLLIILMMRTTMLPRVVDALVPFPPSSPPRWHCSSTHHQYHRPCAVRSLPFNTNNKKKNLATPTFSALFFCAKSSYTTTTTQPPTPPTPTTTARTHASLLLLLYNTRGGAIVPPKTSPTALTAAASTAVLAQCTSSPSALFHSTLLALAAFTVSAKLVQRGANNRNHHHQEPTTKTSTAGASTPRHPKSAQMRSLQWRFLSVFWLLRCSDWMQGPYFYEVYASKLASSSSSTATTAAVSMVSRLFLTGFASTAVFGPSVGRAADAYGRKKATLAFCALYAAGALTTQSNLLKLLFLGRILSGIGTSLLFSAPESWLVSEAQKSENEDSTGQYLGETFAWAYAGDSIVAIAAGQMATAAAASAGGPTGPFALSTVFLLVGGILTALLWGENKAVLRSNETTSVREAIAVVQKDPKIMLVGAVQSLFEAAMYIFVLQWPPAMNRAIQGFFGAKDLVTPYGTIFSCFMACCLLGSTMFGQLAKMAIPTEQFTTVMLTVATVAMSVATWTVQQSTLSLPLLVGAFFAFEACVGMYFPSIGTLRSRYVPDSHRSVIMNLFGIPLNVLVVSVFLSIQKLGIGGALSVSSVALGVATLCMWNLRRLVSAKQLK